MSTTTSFEFRNMGPEHVEQAAAMELVCFPTANPEHLLDAEDLLGHVTRFPAGNFVVLDGERVIGMGCGLLVDYDFSDLQHTLQGVCGKAGANHRDDAPWYYGTDISVHPDYRGHGIGRRLYELRKDVVRRLNKKGIIAGGIVPGYEAHKATMRCEDYVAKVVAGELYDPTLTMQLHNGFEVLGVIHDYMDDPATDNCAAFIRWRNPDHVPAD
jgi:GNAT superfamily N-acetyltransferase